MLYVFIKLKIQISVNNIVGSPAFWAIVASGHADLDYLKYIFV